VTHHLASEGGVTRRISLGFDRTNVGFGIEDSDCRIDRVQFGNELPQRCLRVLDLAGYLCPLAGEAADDMFVFIPKMWGRSASISYGVCAIIPEKSIGCVRWLGLRLPREK
jgi:hypothetical protein